MADSQLQPKRRQGRCIRRHSVADKQRDTTEFQGCRDIQCNIPRIQHRKEHKDTG